MVGRVFKVATLFATLRSREALIYRSVKSTRDVGSVAPHKVQQERTYK